MPYRFRLQEPLDDGARRIAREQLERALAGFERDLSQDQAIHGARRRLKKVRALLRLIRPGLGGKAFHHWNGELRDTGLLFADARDAFVLEAAATSLAAGSAARAKPAFTALQRLIADAQAQRGADLRNNAINAGVERIRLAAAETETLQCGGLSIEDLGKGVAAGLSESRKAFAAAYESGDDETLHEWRKSVQRHWRHMILLRAAWPDFFEARESLAEKISVLLGDDHDLALLKAYIATKTGAGITLKQAETLIALAQARQDKLRADAKVLGQALLSASPKSLSRETIAYWTMSEAQKQRAPKKKPHVNGKLEPYVGSEGGDAKDAAEEEIAEANRPEILNPELR